MIVLTRDYLQSSTARAVPGAVFDRDEKAWVVVEPTPRAAAVALKLFPTLVLEHPELATLRDELASQMRPYSNADRLKIPVWAPRVEDQLSQHGFSWYDYQRYDLGYGAACLEKHGGLYLGWERGLGKTVGACALIEACGASRALVVCPNTAKLSVWKDELAKWMPWMTVVTIRNEQANRIKDLGHVKQLIDNAVPFVFVVHYEALAIIAGSGGKGWAKLGKWPIVIADEAHRLSNPKAKMTRALKRIPSERRVALSGSIIANHAEELFSPLQWLFPEVYRSRHRDWNNRFLDYIEGRWGRICIGVKPDQLEAMQDELGVFLLYRRKDDELDLPPRTDETRKVELSQSQRRIYNELIEDCMSELPDGNLLKVEDGLSLLSKLRQVATGLSLVSDDEIADSSKLDMAIELIKDNEDEAFVVFSWYKASAYEMARRLDAAGIDNYVITGDVPHGKRAQYIEEFQAGQGRVFIGTISTLGESVTLHRANNAIFLDRDWNPGNNDQAGDRIYRIGQGRPVTVTHLVARDTVDEFRVTPVIEDKAALRRLILGS